MSCGVHPSQPRDITLPVLSPWQESADACGVPAVSPLGHALLNGESTADAAAGRAVRGFGCLSQNLGCGGTGGTAYFVLSPPDSGPSTGRSTPVPTTPTKAATQQVPAKTTFVWPASLTGMGSVSFDTSSLQPDHGAGKSIKVDADGREKCKLYSPSSLEASYAGLEDSGIAVARSATTLPSLEADVQEMAEDDCGPSSWGEDGQCCDTAVDTSGLPTTPPTPPVPPLEFAGEKELNFAPAALSKAVAVAGDCEARLRALREVASQPSVTHGVQSTGISTADESSYRSLQSDLEEARERAKGLEARCRVMEEERQDLNCRVQRLESMMQHPQVSGTSRAERTAPSTAKSFLGNLPAALADGPSRPPSVEAGTDLRAELAAARADAARAEARRAEVEASAEAARARTACAEAATFRGPFACQQASRLRAAWSPRLSEQSVGGFRDADAQPPLESVPVQSARTCGISLRSNAEMTATPSQKVVTAERTAHWERPTLLEASHVNAPTRGDGYKTFNCIWELPSPTEALNANEDARGGHCDPEDWQRALPTPTRSPHRTLFSSTTPTASEELKPTRCCSYVAEQFNLSPISARGSERCVPRILPEDAWLAEHTAPTAPQKPFRTPAAPVDDSRRSRLQDLEGGARSTNLYAFWAPSTGLATEASAAEAAFEEP